MNNISFLEVEYVDVLDELIKMSIDWQNENSCYGYRANEIKDIEGNRIFIAKDNTEIIAYLFGHKVISNNMTSIMENDVPYFEIEELYVKPEYRNRGVGSKLFDYVSELLKKEVDYILLSTATKNWKAILHFYIEELGMTFWNARLFKKIK